MSSRKKRTAAATSAHMKNAAERKKQSLMEVDQPIAYISAAEMVASSIYTGTTFKQQHDSLLMLNIQPASHSSFYRKQKDAEEKIKNAVDQSTAKARNNFSGHAAIDCRWSHRIRAPQGTVIMADTANPRRPVIARETLVIKGGGRVNPNYDGLPGNMETDGTDRMFGKLQEEGFLSEIITITRDRDNKSGKILDKYGIRDREFHDPGHYKKNLSTLLAAFVKKYPVYEYYEGETLIHICSPFYGMQGQLQYYLANVMKEEDPDKREQKWLNAVNHFVGDHELCEHSEKEAIYFWKTGYDNPLYKKFCTIFFLKQHPSLEKYIQNIEHSL